MTREEFNTKWKDRIENRFYGLEFDISEITTYLDEEFTTYVNTHDDFEFAQIKIKFNAVRVYTNASFDQNNEWEMAIDKLLNTV